MQMVDVHLPTTDGRILILPRYTEPEKDQKLLLQQLQLELPAQPPPRISQINGLLQLALVQAQHYAYTDKIALGTVSGSS